ncbi:MAG: hypothetical protein EPO27_00735 [Betaproteobacteria bacterium]|nr:MAG: hypothetical protein EPO27_00735 [Betaproteobacteria bacterium]
MSAPGTFTVVNDEALCAAIAATRQMLVYVAPGITKPVVDALGGSLGSQPNLLATVIVDLDPEVYRLGYGTEEGLRALQELAGRQHLELRQQAGVRIGLLVTDSQTLVYSPTPLLIEAGSTSEAKPNAVVIARGADSTASLMRACGAAGSPDQATPAPQDAEIGRVPATPQQVDASLQALKELPPKKFDVARIERVYESKIQFVELELTGYRLSAKRVNIPNDLLLGEDKALKQRLKNSFLLLQGEQTITVQISDLDPKTQEPRKDSDGKPILVEWTEAELERQRKALYDDFLINVPRFGQIIMRRNRPAFDERVSLLKAQIAAFNEAVQKTLDRNLEAAIEALAQTLLPRVRTNIPQRYARVLAIAAPSDEDVLSLLRHDLKHSFGSSADLFKPELRWVFKDVTYESISDKNFRDVLSKALRDSGGERLVEQLFSEHDAAPESDAVSKKPKK